MKNLHLGTIEIETDRLLLRRFTSEDTLDTYNNYGKDPLTYRYIDFAPCKTIESTKEFIDMHENKYKVDPSFYGWAITLDGKVIGSIGLYDIDEEKKSGEVGYSLGSKWWNQGYATEALKAVIRFALEDIGLKTVYGSHHIENKASGRVLEKAGLEKKEIIKDGQKNNDGTLRDLVIYSKSC